MPYKFFYISILLTFSFYLSCSDDPTSTKDDDVPPPDTVSDIDGNVYNILEIGSQWWMAENLKVTHYRNGDPIPNVVDKTDWNDLSSGAYCSYDNDDGNIAIYGLLYNWYAVDDSRIIAPEGWHVPSRAEWQILIDYLGGSNNAGGKMKESGTTHWRSPNTGATNESGFSALPGGARISLGYFTLGGSAFFMSSTELGSSSFWCLHLSYLYNRLAGEEWTKQSGLSVRCVKD
jgi:uncharacterized protein (TIGR02145 family)